VEILYTVFAIKFYPYGAVAGIGATERHGIVTKTAINSLYKAYFA
jgi:hypothetical protein